MKRGLKVKSGVRAPALPVYNGGFVVGGFEYTSTAVSELPACPNNKPGGCGVCWYCIQRGAK